jgi:hypothetical protein
MATLESAVLALFSFCRFWGGSGEGLIVHIDSAKVVSQPIHPCMCTDICRRCKKKPKLPPKERKKESGGIAAADGRGVGFQKWYAFLFVFHCSLFAFSALSCTQLFSEELRFAENLPGNALNWAIALETIYD